MTTYIIKYDGEEYVFTNNYRLNTPEYTLYNNLIKCIRHMINTIDDDWYDESLLFNNYKCPRYSPNNAFIKLTIIEHPLEFSVSEYEYNIYKSLESDKRNEQDSRYKAFIRYAENELTLFHKLYIIKMLQLGPNDYKIYDEITRRKLLSEASINRPKSLNQHELAVEMNGFFLDKPRTMTFNEMYRFYTRNLPNKKVAPLVVMVNPAPAPVKQTSQVHIVPHTVKRPVEKPLETLAEHIDKLNARKDKPKVITIAAPPKKDPFKEFASTANMGANPWSSKFKANDYMKANNWAEEDVEKWSNSKHIDSFNFKQQSKDFMLKTVAPRYSYIIDYFDTSNSKITYMLAVNINTRKAYAIATPDKTFQQGSKWVQNKDGNKSLETAVKQLDELLKQIQRCREPGEPCIKHILCDQEKAFTSKYFHNECKKHGIEIQHYIKNNVSELLETSDESRGNHGALAILDRLCRTIRRMNYNIGNGAKAITPPLMQKLLDEYNRSPHTTLTKILGFPASPNMVDNDKHLEDIIVWTAMRHNIKIKLKDDFNIVGQTVMCLNESGKFDKVKSKLLPGKWLVTGAEHGLFIVARPSSSRSAKSSEVLKLPRYMLKVVDPC